MAEHAWLDVPVGIDVKIFSAPGQAAGNHRTVIPEIDEEHRLAVTEPAHAAPQVIPLFGSGHQPGVRFSPDRHVGEEPQGKDPLGEKHVDVLTVGDDVRVFAGMGE